MNSWIHITVPVSTNNTREVVATKEIHDDRHTLTSFVKYQAEYFLFRLVE